MDWISGLGAMLGAAAAETDGASNPEPARPSWLILQLSEGVEVRYVPIAVTLKDYPKAALRAGDEGTTLLNLRVDSSGLRGCETARSSGSQVLDEQACLLYLERGRFDLRGTSGPVTIKAPVQWLLVD